MPGWFAPQDNIKTWASNRTTLPVCQRILERLHLLMVNSRTAPLPSPLAEKG